MVIPRQTAPGQAQVLQPLPVMAMNPMFGTSAVPKMDIPILFVDQDVWQQRLQQQELLCMWGLHQEQLVIYEPPMMPEVYVAFYGV